MQAALDPTGHAILMGWAFLADAGFMPNDYGDQTEDMAEWSFDMDLFPPQQDDLFGILGNPECTVYVTAWATGKICMAVWHDEDEDGPFAEWTVYAPTS